MLVSVITVSYNSAETIDETINSVADQDYPYIEYIVIDGLSSDNTVDIVRSRMDRVNIIVSEKDCGIYDAMNKGIRAASGDVIAILNSDDIFASKNVITNVVRAFKENQVNLVYGDLEMVSSHDMKNVIRRWNPGPYVPGSFKKGWHPPHPAVFVKSNVYKDCGGYDMSFKISADYEFMIRVFEKYSVSSFYLNKVMVRMRYGGESTGSMKNIAIGNYYIYKAFVKNGVSYPFYYSVIRFIMKIKQFIK